MAKRILSLIADGCCSSLHNRFSFHFHRPKLQPFGSGYSTESKSTAEEHLKQMGRKVFWDKFYQQKIGQQDSFDWFFEYDMIRTDVDQIMSAAYEKASTRYLKVLDIGCGTSSLGHCIADQHKNLNIWCVDFSQEALLSLKKKQDKLYYTEGLLNVDYIIADGFNLPLQNATFDLIFEKGTFDSLLKSNLLRSNSDDYMIEVMRLLNKTGLYCQFSDEDPELRLPLLEKAKEKLDRVLMERVTVSFKQILPDSSIDYFMYYMSFEHCK